MSTCNRLDLETLGSWLIMPQKSSRTLIGKLRKYRIKYPHESSHKFISSQKTKRCLKSPSLLPWPRSHPHSAGPHPSYALLHYPVFLPEQYQCHIGSQWRRVPTQMWVGRLGSEGGVGGVGPNRMKMWSSPGLHFWDVLTLWKSPFVLLNQFGLFPLPNHLQHFWSNWSPNL